MKREDQRSDRLRDTGSSGFERRILMAASQEEPPPEIRERMAEALGVAATAIAAGTVASTAASPGAAAGVGVKAALSSAWAWWLAGVGVASLTGGGLLVAALTKTPAVPAKNSFAAHVSAASATASPESPVAHETNAAPVPRSAMTTVAPEPSVASAPSDRHPPSAVAAPAGNSRGHAAASGFTENAGPAPGRPGEPENPSTLGDQIALVDGARAAVGAHAGDRALALVHDYETRFPRGSFRPEAEALRIEALVDLGRAAEARALGAQFVVEHAGSPLAERVARLTGEGGASR